ncbi:MAG: RHS repeat protein, partial [Planctomycetaceae bacterium]|nr:RHS repeat protein [Planctomycetaceae bacterium]
MPWRRGKHGDFGEYLDTFSNHGFNPADPVFGGAYMLKLRNGTELAINSETGELASITDLTGNTVFFKGDSIESLTGRKIEFTRDWAGRITTVKDSQSLKEVNYAYDGAGNLVSVTDPVQATTQFTYRTDGTNYLDTIIDPLGRAAARTEYTADGRVSKVTDAAGKTIEYTYDTNAESRLQTVTDQLGHVTTITLNSNGDAVREVGPTGSITKRTFDNDHRLLSETTVVGLEDSVANGETNDLTISNTYDVNGNQLTATDKYGNVTRTGYNGRNQPTSQTDAFGNTTQTGYDSRGLPTSIRDANGNVTSLKFDVRSNPTEIRDDNGNLLVTNAYNQYGEIISSTSVFGRTTNFDYDLNGNQVASWYFGGTGPDQVQILNKTEFDLLNRNVG